MTLDELVVKLSADVGNFEKGIEKAKKKLRDLDGENNKIELSASDDDLKNKLNEAKSSLSEFENSNVSPIDIPSPDTDEFENGIDNAENALSEFEQNCNETKQSIEQIFGAVSFGAVAKSIGEMAMECAEASSELTEVQNVVDVAFGSMSQSVNEWAQNAIETMGMSEYAAKNTASTYMSMGSSMGLASQQAAQMSIDITRLSADMASYFNTTQDVTKTALRGIWTGEAEALYNYGIAMTEVTLKNFALSEGIKKSYDEMSQAEKVMLRYQYVMKNTSLAQGDFGRTSKEYAGQQRSLTENINTLKTRMGELVVSGITPALNALNALLKVITSSDTAFNLFQASIIGIVGALAMINFNLFITGIQKLITMCGLATSSFGFWALAITVVAFELTEINDCFSNMSGAEKLITVLQGIATFAAAAAVTFAVFHASLSTALGVGIIAGMAAAAAAAKAIVGNADTSAADSAINTANSSINTSSYSDMASDNSYYGSGTNSRSDRKKTSGSYSYASKSTKVTRYASGGLPDVGELFVSREVGPEMVGTIGGSTAVMNNDQIVAAVSKGVAKAVSAVMGGGLQSVPLTVTLDGDVIYRNQIKTKNRRGYEFDGMGDFVR